MGFSWYKYWSGLPFPPPVDHALLKLSTMTCPSWMALHSMAHSYSELQSPFFHIKAVVYEGDQLRILFVLYILLEYTAFPEHIRVIVMSISQILNL